MDGFGFRLPSLAGWGRAAAPPESLHPVSAGFSSRFDLSGSVFFLASGNAPLPESTR